VRELENLLEHAFVVGQGPVLEPGHLPSYLLRSSALHPAADRVRPSPERVPEALLAALRKHGRNRTLAAMELGIHRSTLWRRMRRWGLAGERPGRGERETRSDPAKKREA
jgi:transcriptional regulator of acetoin/glycerol metabolism